MASHSGVSCDSCMTSNFPGRRYKCLLCDNYDLCGRCFDTEAESQNHKNNHPMQCILTESAAELFYAGESIPHRTVVSLTCPYCGQGGFITRTLLAHCVEKHSSTAPQGKNAPVVMCPICVTAPTHRSRSRFALLADHISATHTNAQATAGDEEAILSPFVTQTRRTGNEDENSDDEEPDEDDEDAPSLNDLEHRAFVEEEHRRQETTRQRLAHVSSLAASARSEYAAALAAYHTSNAQRRTLSRQAAVRMPRGGSRNQYNSFPYGAVPRVAPTLPSSAGPRAAAPDTSTTNTSQNTNINDGWGSAYSQDPMLEFVSQLVNSQPSSTGTTNTATGASSAQFVFAPYNPTQRTSATSNSALEFARLQQQIENNETMAQIKSTLLNAKQKRSSHSQQQAPSSAQPVILNHPSGHDYHLWQQQLPTLQSSTNPLSFLAPNVPNDGSSSASHAASRPSHPSQRENDPRSLLGKILKKDQNVNKDETNEQVRERVSFTHSLLLSALFASTNDEPEETSLKVNKENHL